MADKTQFSTKPKKTLDAVDPATGNVVDVSSLDPARGAGGDGADNVAAGQVTQTEATVPTPADPASVKPSGKKTWYYCMDQAHMTSLDDPSRVFQHDTAGCPVCPVCNKQVNAVETEKGVIPDLRPRQAAGY